MASPYLRVSTNEPAEADLNSIIARAMELANQTDLGPLSDIIQQMTEGTYNLPLKYYQAAGLQQGSGRAQALQNEAIQQYLQENLEKYADRLLTNQAQQTGALNTATQAANAKERTFAALNAPESEQSPWKLFLSSLAKGAGTELAGSIFPKPAKDQAQTGYLGDAWNVLSNMIGIGGTPQPTQQATMAANAPYQAYQWDPNTLAAYNQAPSYGNMNNWNDFSGYNYGESYLPDYQQYDMGGYNYSQPNTSLMGYL